MAETRLNETGLDDLRLDDLGQDEPGLDGTPLTMAPPTLERHQRRLDTVAELARDFAGRFEQQPLLERILEHAVTLLHCESGSISLVNETAGTYSKRVDFGVGCQEGQTFSLNEGVTGRVVRSRSTVILGRYSDVEGGHIAPTDPRWGCAVIGVPIQWNDRVIGTCIIFAAEPGREFTDDDAQLAELFANQAAIALTNSELHTRESARAGEVAIAAERNRVVRDVHEAVGRSLAGLVLGRELQIQTRQGRGTGVLIATDKPLIRAGLVRLLDLSDMAVRVLAEVDSAEQAQDAYLLLQPDVVVIDLDMIQASAPETLLNIRRMDPNAAIVVLTDHPSAAQVQLAREAGVRGFISTATNGPTLARVVAAVATGQAALADGELFDALLGSADTGGEPHHFTARERQVRALVLQGMADKQIARELRISVKTVEKHVGSLLRKTGARNRTMLVSMNHADQHGADSLGGGVHAN